MSCPPCERDVQGYTNSNCKPGSSPTPRHTCRSCTGLDEMISRTIAPRLYPVLPKHALHITAGLHDLHSSTSKPHVYAQSRGQFLERSQALGEPLSQPQSFCRRGPQKRRRTRQPNCVVTLSAKGYHRSKHIADDVIINRQNSYHKRASQLLLLQRSARPVDFHPDYQTASDN